MRTKFFNDEVVYFDDQIVKISDRDVAALKQKAKINARHRMRICTHRDVNDDIHEMIIVHCRDVYVKPHKHLNKIESFHILEGLADIIMFDDEGGVSDIIPMGDYASGKIFYYRISDPIYHTLVVRSEVFVFHEITNGPFKKFDTQFAPWAPQETDGPGVKKFMEDLSKLV